MCSYCGCGMYPYGAYYQYYGYPATYPSYLSYALPVTYAYPTPVALPVAPPVYFAAAPAVSRGEYKVGNCLMICQ